MTIIDVLRLINDLVGLALALFCLWLLRRD
jgi:hypothetical protein